MQVYYGPLAWIVLGMERVKTTTLQLLKNPLLTPFIKHTAPLILELWVTVQIDFRTSRYHNNLAVGAGQFWPMGRLLPTIGLDQWFSNFLHQVPPQKIFGFPSTTIMTNIKMQYKWLPTAPGVCSRCVCVCVCVFTAVCVHGVCVCVCVFTAVCVCTLDGLNTEHKFWVCHVTFTFNSTIHSKKKKNNESVLIRIRIFIIVSLLKYSKYTVWTWTLQRAYFHVNKKLNY